MQDYFTFLGTMLRSHVVASICLFLLSPPWFLFFILIVGPIWHHVITAKDTKDVKKREVKHESIEDMLEIYDIDNPRGIDIYKDKATFFGDASYDVYTAYFVDGDIRYGIDRVLHHRINKFVEIKHEYWEYENLYAYWKNIYDTESDQFSIVDKKLINSGYVEIDCRSFRQGKRFIKRDAEVFARVLYDEGYAIDSVGSYMVALTTKLPTNEEEINYENEFYQGQE